MAGPFELEDVGGYAAEAIRKRKRQLEGVEGGYQPMEPMPYQERQMREPIEPYPEPSAYDRFMEGYNRGIRTIRDYYTRMLGR